ncbi:MAG: aminoglycoside phosphotransferase family protein, partial [Arachnia sp.]
VFDERVDAVELRLRAAAVVISLATGPFRGQEPAWQETTKNMVRSAMALVRQVA